VAAGNAVVDVVDVDVVDVDVVDDVVDDGVSWWAVPLDELLIVDVPTFFFFFFFFFFCLLCVGASTLSVTSLRFLSLIF
jgi:hypothetical protein